MIHPKNPVALDLDSDRCGSGGVELAGVLYVVRRAVRQQRAALEKSFWDFTKKLFGGLGII